MVSISGFVRFVVVALLDTSILKSPAISEIPFFRVVLQISSSVFIKFVLLPCGGQYIPNKLNFLVPPLKVTASASMSLLTIDSVAFALRPFLTHTDIPPPLFCLRQAQKRCCLER